MFITTPLTENRFLYPNLLVFYMRVIIFISIYFRIGTKSLPITLNAEKSNKSEDNNYQPNTAINENAYDVQVDAMSFKEIDSMLSESETYDLAEENITPDSNTQNIEEEYDDELINEILKEIEEGKK